jgi:hypothetical protein
MKIVIIIGLLYLLVAFILGAIILLTNYKEIKEIKWWQTMLFFALQPLLIVREILS